MQERARRPQRAFARVASGIVGGAKAKRKFGQSVSFAGVSNRRGFFDDDDEDDEDVVEVESSQDSEVTDDFFGKDDDDDDAPKIKMTRVKSVRFVEPDKDELPSRVKAAIVQRPGPGGGAGAGVGMRRVKSNFADYFAIRIADVDT